MHATTDELKNGAVVKCSGIPYFLCEDPVSKISRVRLKIPGQRVAKLNIYVRWGINYPMPTNTEAYA